MENLKELASLYSAQVTSLISEKKAKPNATMECIKCTKGATYFRTKDDQAYIRMTDRGITKTLKINSKKFKNFLRKKFYEKMGSPIKSKDLDEAINALVAQALSTPSKQDIHFRICHQGRKIYFDLGGDDGKIVVIDKSGWRVEASKSDLNFIRSDTMLPLPEPDIKGEIRLLKEIINFGTEADFILTAGWLVGVLMPPMGGKPILNITGEQGSAKSTCTRILRTLLDPNACSLRSVPRTTEDLFIGAKNALILAYDNISGISASVSDDFCRIATGGGISKRELYSDSDEIVIEAKNSIIMNGISDPASRSDLIDRMININLPMIPKSQRKTEAELKRQFEELHPKIFGAILNGAVSALQNFEKTKLDELPRMADFAQWVTAAEEGLGFAHKIFLTEYIHNSKSSVQSLLDNATITPFIIEMVEKKWKDTPSNTFKAYLNWVDTNELHRCQDLPKSTKGLSDYLKRVAPNFRDQGIIILTGQKTAGKDSERQTSFEVIAGDLGKSSVQSDAKSELPANPQAELNLAGGTPT